ncbi:uncharacterized protein LOC144170257 isoform X2 [Haemaphysalis longicornis]
MRNAPRALCRTFESSLSELVVLSRQVCCKLPDAEKLIERSTTSWLCFLRSVMSHDLGEATDWDPRAEVYRSAAFNSYTTGPGVHLPLECLPAFSEESQIARSRSLVVKNLPAGLSEAGLKSMFSRCGLVLNCQKLQPKPEFPDKTIGFIDYRTTKEALAAIAALHNKPPFYLKVNLNTMSLSERWKFDARKKEELEEIRRKIEERHGLPAYNVPSQPGASRGRGLLASYTAEDLKSIHVEVGRKPGDQRVFSSPDGSGSSGRSGPPASHGSGSSDEESQVDDRLRVMISDDGSGVQKREVWYTDDPMPFIQECLVCSNFSEYVCNVCKAYYCSEDCQLEDWPKHKLVCRPAKTGLLETPRVKPGENDKAAVAPPGPGAHKGNDKAAGDRTGPQAGLPKKPQGPAGSPIKPNKPSSQPRTPPAQPEPRPPASKPLLSSDKLEPATLPQGGPAEAAQAVAGGGSKQQPLVTVEECPLDTSAGGSFSGVVSAVEGNLVFVQPMDRCSKLLGITQALGDPAVRAAQGTLSGLPPVGQGVLALYSEGNMWYRARVVSVDGARSKARVAFVDYGNEEDVAAKDLLPMTAELAQEASCCLPVVLDGVPLLAPRAVDLLPKEVLTVELVDSGKPPLARLLVDGKCINALAARKDASAAPKQTFVERPLPSGRCKVTISHIDSEGCCYVQQLSLAATLRSMMAELNSGVLTEPLPSPAPGHAAGARYAADGLWYRVRVLAAPEAGQCRVVFVDFGNDEVVPLSDMRVLPEKMKAVHLFTNRVALHGVKSVGSEYAAHLLKVELELEVADATSQPCKVKLYVDDQCLNNLIE